VRFSPGCSCCGSPPTTADCTCFDPLSTVFLTMTGWDDYVCPVAVNVPLSALNASWTLAEVGTSGLYRRAGLPISLGGLFTLEEMSLSCADDFVTGTISISLNGNPYFEFQFSGATNEPGNSCDPLSIAVNDWTAPLKCGASGTTVMPTGSEDVTGEVTE